MAANIEEVKVGGATEVESATPAAAPVSKPKKERTPNQIAQFEAARKKAYEMRSQAKEALKNQRAAQEEAQVVQEESEEEAPPPSPKPKKVKKRKVVVVEAEESSDTEEEMEIRLPPKKEKAAKPAPPPPPDPYAAHYSRMFSL